MNYTLFWVSYFSVTSSPCWKKTLFEAEVVCLSHSLLFAAEKTETRQVPQVLVPRADPFLGLDEMF